MFPDNGEGSHKQVLRFTFAIPPKGSITDMSQMMSLVPLCIDAVASYKMAPEVRKRAVELRSKAEASSLEDARKAIVEAIAAKKTGKMLQEKVGAGYRWICYRGVLLTWIISTFVPDIAVSFLVSWAGVDGINSTNLFTTSGRKNQRGPVPSF